MALPAHHHAGGDGDASAAVGVGHNVAVSDAEEGDGDQPHRVQQVRVLFVVIPSHKRIFVSGQLCQTKVLVSALSNSMCVLIVVIASLSHEKIKL